jgi:CRP/FNR family transcriptional regulator, cyclic AMP receptor protein
MSEGQRGNLSSVKLLNDLSATEVAELEQLCSWRHYSSQEQIIDRQSDTTDIFFISDGRVRIVNYSLSGREITFDELAEGDHFGELAAIDSQPRSASVMSLNNCLVASLSQERFKALLKSHPNMAISFMEDLAGMVRSSTERIMDLSTLAANNRVQAEVLRQAREHSDDSISAIIRPIPVHGDIASRVSTTRETVARVMNDLARQGIVERGKDALVIEDMEQLSDMVEEVRGE